MQFLVKQAARKVLLNLIKMAAVRLGASKSSLMVKAI